MINSYTFLTKIFILITLLQKDFRLKQSVNFKNFTSKTYLFPDNLLNYKFSTFMEDLEHYIHTLLSDLDTSRKGWP